MRPRLPRPPSRAVAPPVDHATSLSSTAAHRATAPRGAPARPSLRPQSTARTLRPSAALSTASDGRLNFLRSAGTTRTTRPDTADGERRTTKTASSSIEALAAELSRRTGAGTLADEQDGSSTSRPKGSDFLAMVESEEKKPVASSSRRPSPPTSTLIPPLPRQFLFPSVADALFEQPLPATESELYSYLHNARATQPSNRADTLAWIHAQPRMARLTSARTYRFLLQYAFDVSNLHLVRTLLDEMRERGIAQNEYILRTLLRGYLRHGKDGEAAKVAAALGVSTAVLAATRAMSVGDADHRGKDKPPELKVLWKGWKTRRRDIRAQESLREQQKALEAALSEAATGLPSKRGRDAPWLKKPRHRPSSDAAPRPSASIPRRSDSLPASDLATLVELVLQEGRTEEAFHLAYSWLRANRPSYAAPFSKEKQSPEWTMRSYRRPPTTDFGEFGQQVAQYHSTAVCLLNTLLRALFAERPDLNTVRNFITRFIWHHSAQPPARPILPHLVSLRELVSGFLGHPDAWRSARDIVDWFGYKWGLPVAGKPHSHRLYFAHPGFALARIGGVKDDELARPPDGEPLHPGPPHAAVSADVALLLLRHAIDSTRRGTLRGQKQHKAVRDWWDALDKDPLTDERWRTYRARVLWSEAVECGLMLNAEERKKEVQEAWKDARKAEKVRKQQEKEQAQKQP